MSAQLIESPRQKPRAHDRHTPFKLRTHFEKITRIYIYTPTDASRRSNFRRIPKFGLPFFGKHF